MHKYTFIYIYFFKSIQFEGYFSVTLNICLQNDLSNHSNSSHAFLWVRSKKTLYCCISFNIDLHITSVKLPQNVFLRNKTLYLVVLAHLIPV